MPWSKSVVPNFSDCLGNIVPSTSQWELYTPALTTCIAWGRAYMPVHWTGMQSSTVFHRWICYAVCSQAAPGKGDGWEQAMSWIDWTCRLWLAYTLQNVCFSCKFSLFIQIWLITINRPSTVFYTFLLGRGNLQFWEMREMFPFPLPKFSCSLCKYSITDNAGVLYWANSWPP